MREDFVPFMAKLVESQNMKNLKTIRFSFKANLQKKKHHFSMLN